MNQGRQTAQTASKVLQDGFQAAQDYVQEKGLDFDVREFVRREPWLAIAGAFAIGFVAAQIIKRIA